MNYGRRRTWLALEKNFSFVARYSTEACLDNARISTVVYASEMVDKVLKNKIENYTTWSQLDTSSGTDISYTNLPLHEFLVVVSVSVYRFPIIVPVVSLVARANNYYASGYYGGEYVNASTLININTATQKISISSCKLNGNDPTTKTMTVYVR